MTSLNERLLKQLEGADRYFAATNGFSALAALDGPAAESHPNSPVLALLDEKMPCMDGMAFVEAYQQLPEARPPSPQNHPERTTRLSSVLAPGAAGFGRSWHGKF